METLNSENMVLENKEKIIDKLCDLAQLDIDAVGAYEKALEHIEMDEIHRNISQFKADHERHIVELSAHIIKLGGEPPKPTPDMKGFFIKGFTALRSITGTVGALKAMQGNEELTNKKYDEALQEIDTPEETRLLLLKNREDERRHLQYIVSTLEKQAQAA